MSRPYEVVKIDEFFEARVIRVPSGCWSWSGSKNAKGYTQLKYGRQRWFGHRLSYVLHVGPIPDGMAVCHACDNRACTNPEHLFLGTLADNNKDMFAKGRGVAPNALKTHCKRGHDLSLAVVRVSRDGRQRRECMPCARAKWQAYYWRRKERESA